jgi:hypothetical protein
MAIGHLIPESRPERCIVSPIYGVYFAANPEYVDLQSTRELLGLNTVLVEKL